MTDSEECLSRSPNSTQICKTLGEESSGRFFCVTGIQDSSRPREHGRHAVLKKFFQKLTEKQLLLIDSSQPNISIWSVHIIELWEQKTIFIDLAVSPPEGYYTQLMSKSSLMVLYELEVKAGMIDPDFTGNLGVVLKNN